MDVLKLILNLKKYKKIKNILCMNDLMFKTDFKFQKKIEHIQCMYDGRFKIDFKIQKKI